MEEEKKPKKKIKINVRNFFIKQLKFTKMIYVNRAFETSEKAKHEV